MVKGTGPLVYKPVYKLNTKHVVRLLGKDESHTIISDQLLLAT